MLDTLEAIVDVYHEDRSIRDAHGGDTIYNVNFHKSIGVDVKGTFEETVNAARAAAVTVAAPAAPEPATAPAAPAARVLVSGRGARRWSALAKRAV
jgi:hypothetical protein